MILNMLSGQAWQLCRDRVQEQQEAVVHVMLHVMNLAIGIVLEGNCR